MLPDGNVFVFYAHLTMILCGKDKWYFRELHSDSHFNNNITDGSQKQNDRMTQS